MPDDTASWKEGAHTELNRRLAKRKQADIRGAQASLASQGAMYSGARQERERQVGQDISETWLQGAQQIEDRAESARQMGLGREHETTMQEAGFGEAERTRGWQTGEREGSQEFEASESEQERNIRLKLQQEADAERYRLEQLVQSGAMDLQQADNEWASFESDLARELEWRTSENQWKHEVDMQKYGSAQEQWMAEFGQKAAMDLQMNMQDFEEFMAQTSRDWELDDRPWQEQMWLLDAQLQMLCAGHDWLIDGVTGGPPNWLFGEETEDGVLDTSYSMEFE